MKKKNPLGLRVLSTAAVMSIITSIAAPAFAGTYYMDNGDLTVRMDEEGKVYVKSGNEEKLDEDGEVTIKGGSGTNTWSNKSSTNAEKQKAEEPQEEPSIGESYPVEEKTEEEPAAEQPEPEEETKEQPEEPENPAEDEQPKPEAPAAEEKTPAEDAAEPEETPDEDTEETDDTEESEDEDAGPAAEDETPVEEDEVPKTTEEAAAAPTKREIAKAPVKPQQEAVTLEAAGEGTAVQDEEETTEEETPTKNVIKVVNNAVNNAVDKVLKIILDNVNIKAESTGTAWWMNDTAMSVSGSGDTKIELNGQNRLEGSYGMAGLNKQGKGTLTITDEETDDGQKRTEKAEDDTTGTLTAVGGQNAAGIGGNGIGDPNKKLNYNSTSNITIEGYATIDAMGGSGDGFMCGGAGIGGGHAGSADNIIIRGNATVTAKTAEDTYGAAIGSGWGGASASVGIYDHAKVTAEANAGKESSQKGGTGIGGGVGTGSVNVTIGTEGKNREEEDVQVTASGYVGVGGSGDYSNTARNTDAKITIQGGSTVESETYSAPAIGSCWGSSNITIKDNAQIKKANTGNAAAYVAIGGMGRNNKNVKENVTVTIQDNAKLGEITGTIGGEDVTSTGVTIKDKAEIGVAYSIEGDKVDILDDAVIKRLYVAIRGGRVTIDGGKDGCVKINEANEGYGSISGTSVSITNDVLIKLKELYGIQVNNKKVDLDKLAKGIGDDAQIWFSENTKDGMTPVKIVHGKNLCTYDENATPIKRKPATCTEDGYEIYQECTYEKNLGATDPWHKGTVTKVLPATGHDWGDWEVVTPATCTKTGLKKRTCKNNPEHFETEVIPVVSDAHTWNDGEVTKAPTCTEKGEKTFTCTNCNATKTEEIPVDPNAHNYTREEGEKEWDEIIPATCTTAGKKVKHCKNALNDKTHDLVETIAIDKDAHNWGEWTTTKKATCTADGEQERVCKNDTTHKETKKIDATGHQHTKIVGKKDATETEPGYTGDKVCDKCGEIIEKGEVIPAKGHTWVKGEHHDANCMKGGYDDYTCSGCGATKEEPDGTTPNNDHDYSGEEWDEITNATCTTDGKKVKHCKRPGADATHDKTEVIPATGHEKTHIEGKKEPTCEEPGYTGDKVCDKCGDVVEKGEVIPAKGHTPTVVGRKDPTETEPGYTGDTVCADCGKLLEKGEVIPATGKKDAENAEALELRVVVPGNTLRDLLFTVRQAGTERTYTCKKADATLTGTLETLQYLQANGAETIVFVTNGRVSRFAVADLLALCDEGDVFYLCHTADAEPTLLIIANDHTELLNK